MSSTFYRRTFIPDDPMIAPLPVEPETEPETAAPAHPRARRWLKNLLHFAIGVAVGAFLTAPVLEWLSEGMPQ